MFQNQFLASYIYVVQQLKNKHGETLSILRYFFILSEWCDKGVAVATWEENNMAVQGYRLIFFLKEQAGPLKQYDLGPGQKLRGRGFSRKSN